MAGTDAKASGLEHGLTVARAAPAPLGGHCSVWPPLLRPCSCWKIVTRSLRARHPSLSPPWAPGLRDRRGVRGMGSRAAQPGGTGTWPRGMQLGEQKGRGAGEQTENIHDLSANSPYVCGCWEPAGDVSRAKGNNLSG